MNSQSEDLISKLPNDLLSAEILPWLSFGQLSKVARVSKKLSNIVKNTAPFVIDTFYSGWLDRERVLPHLDRCKHLTTGKSDKRLLERLASAQKLNLETLDVSYLKDENDSREKTQYIASILKTTPLKVLRVPATTDFKYLVAENVICHSVHHLTIRNPFTDPHEPISTADVFKIFPSLTRLDIYADIIIDIEQYLSDHPECKLEHIRISNANYKGEELTDSDSLSVDEVPDDNAEGDDEDQTKTKDNRSKTHQIALPLKSLKLKGYKNSNKDLAKYNVQQLKHLALDYGLHSGVKFLLPNLEHIESLELCIRWDPKSFEVLANASRLQHLKLRLPHDIWESKSYAFPQSLKSLELDSEADFNLAAIAVLPNLESLRMQSDYMRFWNFTETPSFATVLKRIDLRTREVIEHWSPMNSFINLTHVTIDASELNEIPIEFFKNCTKVTHFSLQNCDNVAELPTQLSLWTELESLKLFKCALTSIPEGLSDLPNLHELDLRGNSFTLESAPVTLPIATVAFKDREWIQLIQRYIKDKSAAPTVAQTMKLPFLRTYKQLEDGRLARVTLHGCKKLDKLEPEDDNSDYLAAAIMRSRRTRIAEEDAKEYAKNPFPYLAKDQTLGIILFHEFLARSEGTPKGILVLVESNGINMITTYSYTHPIRKGNRGWSSRAVWDLIGHIHEFEGLTVKAKMTETICVVVEGK